MADKLRIFWSPLGMFSMLRGDYVISVFTDDGKLDEKRLNEMIAGIANAGANAIRDFYWLDSDKAYDYLTPFKYDGHSTVQFNESFFDNQRKIATVCNQYGVRYYSCLFDECGTKSATQQWNPWKKFSKYFYGNDAKELRHQYIDKFLNCLNGTDFGFDLCNEPRTGVGDFLAETFLYLHQKNFDNLQAHKTELRIILGNDYYLKETIPEYGQDYRVFRDTIVDKLGEDWSTYIKTICMSPVHHSDWDTVHDLWGDDVTPGGDRVIFYSQDGVKPRPDKDTMYKLAKEILTVKSSAREQQKVHFEVLYGKTKSDPLDSVAGVVNAYKEVFGTYPDNYGKFSNGPIDTGGGDDQDIIVIPPDPESNDSKKFETQIRHAYLGLWGCEPDTPSLQNYINYMMNGGDLLVICQQLVASLPTNPANNSDHEMNQTIDRLYQGILGREPDKNGKKDTEKMIREGHLADRARDMLYSEEFKNKYLA